MCFLWLTRTRQDLLQDVVTLQREMLHPTGSTLKAVNSLVKQAIANRHLNGLHFRYLGPRVRLVQFSDAGHITKTSSYPHEGRMVLLCQDHACLRRPTAEYFYAGNTTQFGGPTCVLYVSSKRAPRVSYSTSHSETNPAVSTSAVSSLLGNRFTEIDHFSVFGKFLAARDLLQLQLHGNHHIPVDMNADAMNLFELICHTKSLPNDKHHRVGILALREERLTRRIRDIIHLPSGITLPDQLTKKMISPISMTYCTTGIWDTTLHGEKVIRIRHGILRPSTYTEEELMENKLQTANGTVGAQLDYGEYVASFMRDVAV